MILMVRNLIPRFVMAVTVATLLAACAGNEGTDGVEDEDAVQGREARLDEFEATGETRNCISIVRIRQSPVLSDRTILFEMINGDYYVNRLPNRCPQLGFERRFSYSLGGMTDLCNTDIIRVITSTGAGAGCGLGMFERLVPKDETEMDEATNTSE